MNTIPEMLTIAEVAERTKLAKHYVRNLVLSGKVVHVRCGKKYLINFQRFINFLQEGDTIETFAEYESKTIRKIKI